MGERLRGRREKDGVERTHREARSHDLMNELAWLLAAVVGRHSRTTLSPCFSPVVFHPPLAPRRPSRGTAGGTRAVQRIELGQDNPSGVKKSWVNGTITATVLFERFNGETRQSLSIR